MMTYLASCLLVVLLALPADAATQLRLQFEEFVKDPARVASLAKGIRVMKSRDTAAKDSAEYRTSWEYWGAMHGYYGKDAGAGPLQGAIDAAPPAKRHFFDGLTDLEPPGKPAGVAEKTWDKCEHGSQFFLPWHRLYLFYFERVLRAAAGDDTLRLPYWDYTDPGQVALPAEFGQPGSASDPNPLFDSRRASQHVALDEKRTNIDKLIRQPDFLVFEGNLEQQPHGYVHCTVGPGCPIPLMGDVPVAALDPIFWLHHANIDRLWECWIKGGGKVPADPGFQNQTFAFVDEKGALQERKVSDLFGPGSIMDYAYDNVTHCGRKPPTAPIGPAGATVTAAGPAQKVASAANVAITDAVTTTALKVPKAGPEAQAFKHSLALPQPPPSAVELVFDGITVKTAPGVMLDVFVAKKGFADKRAYVGTLTFFGAGRGHGTHVPSLRRVFDVTEQMRSIAGSNAELEDLDVVFEATTGEADAKLEDARPLFNPASDIRVGTITLQVRPGH